MVMKSKKRVMVAMSGGLDSAISALLLHRQGYEVVGLTMKTWDYNASGGSKKETGCCSLDSINDARQLAVDNNFQHIILDIRDEFGDIIIKDFVNEYVSGRTPNPCVLCNTFIKWDALLKRAEMLNCDYIATGHYAKIKKEDDRYIIAKPKDITKDQTYFLWGLSQDCLKKTIFPLADLTKDEVRDIALKEGYQDLASKSESYEVCFIPDNNYNEFLKRKVKGLEEKVNNGNFISVEGDILGKHKGYPFYTVGQRKIGLGLGFPAYVVSINAQTNEIVLGTKDDLVKETMSVIKFNFIKYDEIPVEGLEVVTKIRYRHQGVKSRLKIKNKKLFVDFFERVEAVAPGQSAVFYYNDDVVGGGIIA